MAEKELTYEEEITKQTQFSKIPVLARERFLGWNGNFSLAIAANIASWLIVTGCWMGMLVPVPIAILLSIAGAGIAIIAPSLISRFASRYGLDQGIYLKVVFGSLGVFLVLIPLIVIFWGWACIPIVMFGRISQSLIGIWGGSTSAAYASPVLWTLVCFGLGLYLSWVGPRWQQRVFMVAAPAMVVLLIMFTIRMITHYGWSELMAVIPPYFAEDPKMAFMLAWELQVGCGFSWFLVEGEWSRQCKSERIAFWPNALSWGILWGVFCIPSIFVGAMAGVTDIVTAVMIIGGAWTVLYLILMILANPSSVVLIDYAAGLTFKTMFRKLKWHWAVLTCIPATIALSFWVYDWYGAFVSLISEAVGVVAGVAVVHMLLAKTRISLKDAYAPWGAGAYGYWKGVNWPAIAACIVGFTFSFAIYNPMTMVPHVWSIFGVVGAGIPACLVGGLTYYILYRIFLKPKRIGFPEVPEYSGAEPTVTETRV
jgi:NCS1 family nucleobase:cation symporter-1